MSTLRSHVCPHATALPGVRLQNRWPCHRQASVPLSTLRSTRRSCKADEVTALSPVDLNPNNVVSELQLGTFWAKCERIVPKPPWGIKEVIKVSQLGVPLGLVLAAVQIAQILLSQPGGGLEGGAGPGAPASSLLRSAAQSHLGQEFVLLGASAGLLWAALGHTRPRSTGLFRYALSSEWLAATAALCTVLFPIVDPLIYTPWSEAVRHAGCLASSGDVTCSSSADTVQTASGLGALFVPQAQVAAGSGPEALAAAAAAAPSYKATLLACVQGGDYSSLAMHFAASCLIGPLWEETFWRGFLLPSITSRLPGELPAAVVTSSATFALMHLNLAAGLPIFVLSCACDALYLRSGSISTSWVLHASWNAYQLLGVAFFGKEAFV